MKILITGASGLLGSNLSLLAAEQGHDIFAITHTQELPFKHNNLQQRSFNLSDPTAAALAVDWAAPEAIIHCAALTNVDQCEKDVALAELLNIKVTEHLATLAKRRVANFVHISTDAVFDGQRDSYNELSDTNPINIYSKTKFRAEEVVQEILPNALIVRTTMYGWNAQDKQSLSEWILTKLNSKEAVPAFSDVVFSPLFVNDLAILILEMMTRKLSGIYNTASSDAVSKLLFAQMIAEMFGYKNADIKPTLLADCSLFAPRPLNTSLDVHKLTAALDKTLPTVQEGLRRFKSCLDSGYVNKLKGRHKDA